MSLNSDFTSLDQPRFPFLDSTIQYNMQKAFEQLVQRSSHVECTERLRRLANALLCELDRLSRQGVPPKELDREAQEAISRLRWAFTAFRTIKR